MRQQSWTCRCGTDLFATSPVRGNATLHAVQCPECGETRLQLTGSPLKLFRVGPTFTLLPVAVYGKRPPQRAIALPSRRHADTPKAANG